MAFRSRKRAPEAGDNFIDSGIQSKKTRTANNANSDSRSTDCKIDSNGDRYWEISKMRRVSVSTFRGKTMVNIREYYEKDGQELPGKKVSLTLTPLLLVYFGEREYDYLREPLGSYRVSPCRWTNLQHSSVCYLI